MQYIIVLIALLSALVWHSDARLVERQTIVPIVTIQTITVTPSMSSSANAVSVLESNLTSTPASLTMSSSMHMTTLSGGSIIPMSGPGASSNGQTGTGAGAGAKTYLTTDAIGETFVEVVPSNAKTVYASVPTEGVTTKVVTTTAHSSSDAPPPSSSTSKQMAAATALPMALFGVVGMAGLVGAI